MAKCQVPPASGKTSWASSATEIPCCESPFCWGFQFSWGFVCICQLKLNLTWDLYRVMSPHSFRLYFVFALVCISYMLVCFLFVFVFVFSVFASACISYIIRLFYQCGGICGSQFQTETHTGLRAFPSQLQLLHCNLLLAFAFQDFWVCVVS